MKGYQRGENDYVILEDEELENVALDSPKTIDIDIFSPARFHRRDMARHALFSVAGRSGRPGGVLGNP